VWLRPLENLVHQTRRLLVRGVRVWTVARQSSALLDIKRVDEHGWDALLRGDLQYEPLNIPGHRGRPQDPIDLALADPGEGRLRLGLRLDHLFDQHKPQAPRRFPILLHRCYARGIGWIVGEQDPVQTRDKIPKYFETLWPQVNV